MQKFVKTKLLLALAGFALAATPAKAQYSEFADGNMFLGFYVPGTSTDLLVYIGNYTDYTTGGVAYTGSTETLFGSTGSIGSNTTLANDLTSIFGSSWATTVKWGVVGTYDAGGAATVFLTDPLATSSAAHYPAKSSTNQGIATGDIQGIDGEYGSETGGAGGLNTQANASTNDNSYYAFTPSGAHMGGASLNVYSGDFNKLGTGGLYLDELNATDASSAQSETPLAGNGTAIVLGQFNLSSDGTVTYAAVPEPSTYAMMGIGALLLVLAVRRRRAFSTI